MRVAGYQYRLRRMRQHSVWSICAEWLWLIGYVWIMGSALTGCRQEVAETVAIEYSMCESGQLPRELSAIIESKKDQPFRLSYRTSQYTYIVVGYGMQPRGGCQVVVEDLYEQDGMIYITTNLIGERGGQVRLDEITYPYAAVRIEDTDQTVVYR